MNHHASPEFWRGYRSLPISFRRIADRCFDLLKRDPRHPSLHFKKVGRFRPPRVGSHRRALGVESPDGIVRFWIGSHADYDKRIG